MFMKFNNVQNKNVKRLLEHVLYLIILFVLIPTYFYFEIAVVLPSVAKTWSTLYIIHLSLATFLLLNIIGNMIYGMFTNSSIKGKLLSIDTNCSEWSMCTVCESVQPPRAWHCDMCNVCILKRDHHCTFLATCVGYYNQRYFMFFVFYIFIAMMYAFYFNVQFLSQFVRWNHGFAIIQFIFPLASFVFDFGLESLYIFLVVINVFVGAFSGYLFYYHFRNILEGKTVNESKNISKHLSYNYGWRLNLIEVFGKRWYLSWLFPFISSPTPGNGMDWVDMDKSE